MVRWDGKVCCYVHGKGLCPGVNHAKDAAAAAAVAAASVADDNADDDDHVEEEKDGYMDTYYVL